MAITGKEMINFKVDMEAVAKNQMEILEKKNVISQLKNSLYGLYSRLYTHTHKHTKNQ